MNLTRMSWIVLSSLLCVLPRGVVAADEQLTISEVKPIMRTMLDQHIETRVLNPDALQEAILVFLEEADPERIYLLDEQFRSYQNMSRGRLLKITQEYRRDDFGFFHELNEVVAKAILRVRENRAVMLRDAGALLFEAERRHRIGATQSGYSGGWDVYARNLNELDQRSRLHFLDYADGLMERFGINEVMDNQALVVQRYESYLRRYENEYLYETLAGAELSSRDREHFFATHVLQALARSLDPHSSFMDESEAWDMKLRLEKGFVGIGVVLTEMLDGFVITELLKNSPAERSGLIKPEDRLVKINGESLLGLSLDEVVGKVRGKQHATVELSVRRGSGDNTSFSDVHLKPDMIIVDDERVDTSFEPFMDGIIGRITLYSFYEGPGQISAASDVENAINALKKEGKLLGLVLDLRDNSGGYLTQAVKVAGLFITNGVVVMSRYSTGEQHYYRDLDGETSYDGPMVVLTSRMTASAAEIVAQALQDYGVALVVGDQHTYGKGTIQAQTVTDSDGSSAFKVTVGQYYTVSGLSTQLRGVEADVILSGAYSKMAVGESYLDDTVAGDSMHSAFQDKLWDIEPRARGWYERYYLPTLQVRSKAWQQMIPSLREGSVRRVRDDIDYQRYLRDLVDGGSYVAVGGGGGFDIDSYQISEATNIVRDMLRLGGGTKHQQGDVYRKVGAPR